MTKTEEKILDWAGMAVLAAAALCSGLGAGIALYHGVMQVPLQVHWGITSLGGSLLITGLQVAVEGTVTVIVFGYCKKWISAWRKNLPPYPMLQ